jgi:hypothetical protein
VALVRTAASFAVGERWRSDGMGRLPFSGNNIMK